MEEEIGCGDGYIIAESKNWYSYRVPDFLIPRLWDGKYCGQKQKWFLLKFLGNDSQINLAQTNPEFHTYEWVDIYESINRVVPFKMNVYKEVISYFQYWFK